MTHDMNIPPIILKSKAPIPLASPTPTTAATAIRVVEAGIPVREGRTKVAATASSAKKTASGYKFCNFYDDNLNYTIN